MSSPGRRAGAVLIFLLLSGCPETLAASSSTSVSTRTSGLSNSPLRKKGKLHPSLATSLGQHAPLSTAVSADAAVSGEETNAVVVVERGGAASSSTTRWASVLQTAKVLFYFALWYALNIYYNIINKKVLNVLPAPLTVGSIQFGIGAAYSGLLWATRLRSRPVVRTSNARKAVWNVGFWHCTGQLASMISLGAGPVSFTHIVKALEPFFSAAVSAFLFGKWMKPQVYTTLLPVVGGVSYAVLNELQFSWLAFSMAMVSNVAFALRAVYSKLLLQNPFSGISNLTSANLFGLVTVAAFVQSLPMALIGEGLSFGGKWSAAMESREHDAGRLIRAIIISGLFHYLNNEVMYLALGNVHPVTLAVGNTMKRVFIMVASVMVFGNPITLQAAIGSGVGIAGVLLYSLTKQHYEKLEAAQKARKRK